MNIDNVTGLFFPNLSGIPQPGEGLKFTPAMIIGGLILLFFVIYGIITAFERMTGKLIRANAEKLGK